MDAGVAELLDRQGLELVIEAQQLWNDCSHSLRSQVSEATWRAWFSSIRPITVANGTLVLAVPSAAARDRLEGRFHGLINEALLDSSGEGGPIPLRRADRRTGPGRPRAAEEFDPVDRRGPCWITFQRVSCMATGV